MKNRNHGLSEKEIELVKLLMSIWDDRRSSGLNPTAFTRKKVITNMKKTRPTL